MISNTTELNETLTTLSRKTDYAFGAFSSKMSSDEINTIFKKIEASLDDLYIKTRLLEDLRVFAEGYVQNEFKKKSINLKTAIKTIQKAADDYENTNQIAQSIPFNSSSEIIVDRDGTSIRPADVMGGNTILMAGETLKNISMPNVVVDSPILAYRRISSPAENYRSFYVLENPAPNGVTEKLQILFSKIETINYLDLSVFKSSIQKGYLIRSDNELIELDLSIHSFEPQKVKGIQIELSSNIFDMVTINVSGLTDSYNALKNTYKTNVLNSIYATYISQKESNYVS